MTPPQQNQNHQHREADNCLDCACHKRTATAANLAQTNPEQFVYKHGPANMATSAVLGGVYYGFTQWILPFMDAFYPGWTHFTFENGSIMYIFSLAPLWASIFPLLPFFKPLVAKIGVSNSFCLGYFVIFIGTCLTGLAIAYMILWLFAVGWIFIVGSGLGIVYTIHVAVNIGWYKEVGRTGAGNGWSGFFLGFWPAVFSFLIYALLKAGISLAGEVIILGGLCMLIAMINAPLNGILPSPVKIAFYGTNEEEGDEALSIIVSNVVSPTVTASCKDEKPMDIITGEGCDANDTNEDGDFIENDKSLCHDTNTRDEKLPLNAREIVSCGAFWVLWLPTLLNVATASGLKFAVSPMLSLLYDAQEDVRTTASVLFFLCFAFSRLVMGRYLDRPHVNVRTVHASCLLGLSLSFIALGLLIHFGGVNSWSLWFVIVLLCVEGVFFGTMMVCLFPLYALLFRAEDYALGIRLVTTAQLFAPFIGALCIWQSFTGDITQEEALEHVSYFMFAATGCSSFGFVASISMDTIGCSY